jgi:hypothetical protein
MPFECIFATLSSTVTLPSISSSSGNSGGHNADEDDRIEVDTTSNIRNRSVERASRWLAKSIKTNKLNTSSLKSTTNTLTQLYNDQPELFLIQTKRNRHETTGEGKEEIRPPIFQTSPSSGTVEIGETVSIDLQYTPRISDKNDITILLIKMPCTTMCGQINGRGGEPSLIFDIDAPENDIIYKKSAKRKKRKNKRRKKHVLHAASGPSVVEFGTCRTGSVHNRTINISNCGQMDSTNLSIEADPSDIILADGSRGGKTMDWERIAAGLGVRLTLITDRTDGVLKPGSVAKIHVRFTAKSPQ